MIKRCKSRKSSSNIKYKKASGGDRIPAELFQILQDDVVKVLHSICQQIWKTQQWPRKCKRSVFFPIPKKGNAKEYSSYHAIALISHASKVMPKILQTRLQQYENCELPDAQAGFRKDRGTRQKMQISIVSSKKQQSSRKISTSALLNMPNSWTVWITTNWKILKEMEIPDQLTCLWRNLYAGQESIVRTGHGTTDWFQIRKGICQGCILSPCLFNLYAVYTMRIAGLDEVQAGIKIAGRNINNLRYADDTTLMAESEEELNSLLMKVKEKSENVGLKLNIQKTKIMASSPITSWQIDGERVQNSERLYYFGLQNHCR